MTYRHTILLTLLSACAEIGSGTLVVELSGEEASREGYPVGEGEEAIAFVDGWEVDFDKVITSIDRFVLETGAGERASIAADPLVADLHLGEPEAWRFEDVGAQRWDRVSYRFAPPPEDARRIAGVSEEDVDRMRQQGWSFLITGRATRDSDEIQFELGFPLLVDNVSCVSGVDETDGVVLSEGGITQAQITVHLDHLFFDSLAAEEPNLRFEPMAAVAAGQMLALDDMTNQSITDVRDRADARIEVDGSPLVYDPGDAPLGGSTLKDFFLAAATTMGHFNGEGHCDYDVQSR